MMQVGSRLGKTCGFPESFFLKIKKLKKHLTNQKKCDRISLVENP